MTQAMKEAILTVFDEGISKNKAIQSICKMYDMPREEVIEILKEGNRQIPYERKPAPVRSKDAEEIRAAVEEAKRNAESKDIPVANYIYEVLADKMDELEYRIRELEMEREFYVARFKTIHMYIKENNL